MKRGDKTYLVFERISILYYKKIYSLCVRTIYHILEQKTNKSEMMCISNRLKQVLLAKNLTVKEFSSLTGISYRSAMNYLNEGRDPNVESLIKFHKILGINLTWLLTGEGAMFFQSAMIDSPISIQEQKLINYYRQMPEFLKDAFLISFKEILNKKKFI